MSFYIGHGSSNWPAVREAEHFAANLTGHARRRWRRGSPSRTDRPRAADAAESRPGRAAAAGRRDDAPDLHRHALVTVGDHELVIGLRATLAILGRGTLPLLDHQDRFTWSGYRGDDDQ